MIRLIDERVMEKLRDKPENIDLEEFLPLVGEWREDKASKAKCPYCVKPIEKQATKCNHCLSEIEWFKFDGLYGPCKAGASEEMEAALVMAKATFHGAKVDKVRDYVTNFENSRCVKCDERAFTPSEINTALLGTFEDAQTLDFSRRYTEKKHKCVPCAKRDTKIISAILILIFIAPLIWVFWVKTSP
ncbi:hypothetical protein N8621_02045 [Akkermansiaceae bacterium]|nr:hypothetical protein [Akkermansiaceae bacterium]